MERYYTPRIWKLREDIERSKAIKCPDIYTQITNLKYIQYLINKEETWAHFGFDQEVYRRNRETFCEMYIMDDFQNDKDRMLQYVEANGGYSSWVLKPQQEGGGHNFFGESIRTQIMDSTIQVLRSCILMKLINVT